MPAILLAGGPSKGLELVTGRKGSRSLLRLPGATLLEKHVQGLSRYFDEIYVVSDDPLVERLCGKPGCRFVPQRAPGVEGALCSALSSAGVREGLVTIIYGDIYYEQGFVDTHMSKVAGSYEPVITVTRPLFLRGTYLRLEVDTLEARVQRVGSGSYIYAGLLTAPAKLLVERLCSSSGTVEKVIEELASRGLIANIWLGNWIDIDTPWDYLVAVRLELSKLNSSVISSEARIGRGVVFEGPVIVEPEAVIDHYAVIKGPAYIAPGALVGAHSFLRGPTAVYNGAIVGAYTEVKRSILYERSTVGSHSYIADSIVGREARVASYTVTLNTPYQGGSGEIVIMTTNPLEDLKLGSVIAATASTRPHDVIPPATLYKGIG